MVISKNDWCSQTSLPTFYLIQALFQIFSEEFITSTAFLYCWFSCFHALCYLGKTTSWDPRQLCHIHAILNKKSLGKKYARMGRVPLSSLSIIKIPVDPATLDAWEELLIFKFKPSLNSLGIMKNAVASKIHSAYGENAPQPMQSYQKFDLSRKTLSSSSLSWTIFSSVSWASTSLVTLANSAFEKGKTSLMRSISHGQMLNI